MNLSDTFYVALCMTVLILGVVYWFWTQNQYTQRKLNLLENIVYEMKTTLSSGNSSAPDLEGTMSNNSALSHANYPPAPSSVLGEDEDLLHEELHAETIASASASSSASAIDADHLEVETTIDSALIDFVINNSLPNEDSGIELMPLNDDLQPGGVGSGIKEVVTADVNAKGSVLDTMTIAELKRLAEQRGISGASKMRKQALIDSIRAAPVSSAFDSKEALLELS